MADKVLFYMQHWYCFDNFSSFGVFWRGEYWPTVEHAYQGAKFLITRPNIAEMIRHATSAHNAKKMTKQFKNETRKDWSKVKLQIMEELVRAKLQQHEYVRRKLIETGEMEMVEDSPTDAFWGRGPDGNGQNHMGKIWMKLRKELFEKQISTA